MSLRILAIETSTHPSSAAILYEGEILYRENQSIQQNSQHILPLLEAVLAEAGCTHSQLDGIAFGCGPGQFTGIRLAASIAQATALALNIPVIPVSTLRALAQDAWQRTQHQRILVAIDARLQQIYWGEYELGQGGIIQICNTEAVCYPNKVSLPNMISSLDDLQKPELDLLWMGTGSGWDCYHQLISQTLSKSYPHLNLSWISGRYPRAYDIAILANHDFQKGFHIQADAVMPAYLRGQVTHIP